MAGTYIKATKVVDTLLGLLVREMTLPGLVWRDAAFDPTFKANDTVSIRLPAFMTARSRTLRGGAGRTKDHLFERKVDVTLDTDVYLDVPITDEEMTLDISDFGFQVLNPIVEGILRKLEDELADTISGATYENTIAFVESTDDVWSDMVLPAREYLNNANVPFDGRALLVGSAVERLLLDSAKLLDASQSGSTGTLRNAQIGRIAGMDVFTSNAIDANEAYAFHKTAYALVSRAPIVPLGASWGSAGQYQGFAVRALRNYDSDAVEDRFLADSWIGTSEVKDNGHFTDDPDTGGKFIPVTDPANPIAGHTDAWRNDSARLVRSVKVTVS